MPRLSIIRTINWKLTVFSLFFLVVFVHLGFWQIDRGYEKREIIKVDERRRSETGISISALLQTEAKEGQPVLLKGQFDPEIRLLKDNVVLKRQVGFELVVPFQTDSADKTLLLVNLGFLPMGRTRADLPSIPQLPLEQIQIRGHLYLTKPNPMIQSGHQGGLSQLVVQSVNPSEIASLTNQRYYDHLIRLDQDEPMALPRHWPLVVMLPSKHFGYALTWFLMALALFIAFAAFTVKTHRETLEND